MGFSEKTKKHSGGIARINGVINESGGGISEKNIEMSKIINISAKVAKISAKQ
ncbi:hypothetical protein KGR20_23300 [Cytobacillus oceanisediminis]|uniref:Uncharacterized protein n=1 Tax=Niallia alba TaxID=2729105 RepID=A0A7Y0KCG9_9BACI|nr:MULTISPECIES: hypothetical protein [Bacillaceae]MBQ6446388.1 hypothetical protein [Bacillus sp. (in: firmicutes)]MBZ9537090.1 hypothetical protein [Cytobacillus oceanisediminis]NMO79588.1 hypothetical protein [Niallia alba]